MSEYILRNIQVPGKDDHHSFLIEMLDTCRSFRMLPYRKKDSRNPAPYSTFVAPVSSEFSEIFQTSFPIWVDRAREDWGVPGRVPYFLPGTWVADMIPIKRGSCTPVCVNSRSTPASETSILFPGRARNTSRRLCWGNRQKKRDRWKIRFAK